MRIKTLRKKVRREARRGRRNGTMYKDQYEACMKVIDSPEALEKLNEQIEAEVNPWNRNDALVGAGWQEWFANLWDWFKENWPAILAFIMKLAPLLLILEPTREDS